MQTHLWFTATLSGAPFLKCGEKTSKPVEPIYAVFSLFFIIIAFDEHSARYHFTCCRQSLRASYWHGLLLTLTPFLPYALYSLKPIVLVRERSVPVNVSHFPYTGTYQDSAHLANHPTHPAWDHASPLEGERGHHSAHRSRSTSPSGSS
jgi:hypothetical protein